MNRAQRLADEIRPVVERLDPHAFRQDGLVQLPDLVVDRVEDDARILAPSEEREACTRLWADVATLLKSAEAVKK